MRLNNKLKSNLRDLRKNIRKNQTNIINKLRENHNSKLCIFCGEKNNLTKEHILPQWIYEKKVEKFFITNANGLSQTYNKSVLPCCSKCNNDILGYLESNIQSMFQNVDLNKNHFNYEELELIILWLEIISYKLQVMDIRRKFRKHKDSEFIPYLAELPIALLSDLTLSPAKVFSNLRNSLKSLSIKSKSNKINSLLIFITKNDNFHFMHKTNVFVFLELPQLNIALFYFLNEEFENHKDANEKCMEILKDIY